MRVTARDAIGNESSTTMTLGCITEQDNQSPVPDARLDQKSSYSTGTAITYDGTNSADPDGQIVNYRWSFASIPAGSSLTDTDLQNVATSSFTPDVAGDYRLRLQVEDNEGATSTDTTRLIAVESGQNTTMRPTADARITTASPYTTGQGIDYDGSGSSDSDGSITNYRWTFADKPGPSSLGTMNLRNGSNAETGTFTPDVAGNYQLRLEVEDNDGATDADQTKSISVGPSTQNFAPDADARITSSSSYSTGQTVDYEGGGRRTATVRSQTTAGRSMRFPAIRRCHKVICRTEGS